VFNEAGSDELSYRELSRKIGQFARGLIRGGVERGDRVALLAPIVPSAVVACFGIIRAGGVVTLVDTQFGGETLRHVLENSEARQVVTTESHWERIQEAGVDIRPILIDGTEEDERSVEKFFTDDGELPDLSEDDGAALFYTSGTTGPSKGVPLTHGNLVFQIHAIIEAELVERGSRVLLPLPLHHVYPFSIGVLTTSALGLTVVIPHSLTGPELIRAIREGEVTVMIGVPRLYDALFDGIQSRFTEQGGMKRIFFESALRLSSWVRKVFGVRIGGALFYPLHKRLGGKMEIVASGGAPLAPDLAWNLEALGWKVAIGYGLTETSPLLTMNEPGRARLDAVGKPLEGVEIRIAPPDNPGKALGSNEAGEVLARGPGVFRGYDKLPEKSNESLTEDGWFRTGDLGYLDEDNYLHITGRVSTVIVTEAGENIQPQELEEVYELHRLLKEVGVLQDDGKLAAVVVPDFKAIKQSLQDELVEAVAAAMREQSQQVASYKRVADYVISHDALDRTRLGKVQRHKLQERYHRLKEAGGTPEETSPIAVEEMQGEDRELLRDDNVRKVWELLAERNPDRRLTPDSYLDIDSLEWVDLTFAISDQTGMELQESALMEVETARDLLQAVADAAENDGKRAANIDEVLENPDDALDDKQKRWLKPHSAWERRVATVAYYVNRGLMKLFFRLRVEGLDNVPLSGPYAVTPNHLSYLDAFFMCAALDIDRLKHFHWGGWEGFAFRNRLFRFASRLAQTVPVDQERAAMSSMAFAAALMKEGEAVGWFPEGQRSQSGALQRFRPGIGLVLQHYEAPAVPVFIHGAYEAMPPGRNLIKPVRVTVVFGEPVRAETLEKEGEEAHAKDRIADGLRRRVAALGEPFHRA